MKKHLGSFLMTIILIGGGNIESAFIQKVEMRSTTDGVFTEAQALRGAEIQTAVCGDCHQPDFYTGGLVDAWAGNTVGALFQLIVNTMPENSPSSLKDQEYADLMAYILRINEFPVGKKELPGDDDALMKIVIERRNR